MSEEKGSYNLHQRLLKQCHLKVQRTFHTVRLFEAHVGQYLALRVIDEVIALIRGILNSTIKNWILSIRALMRRSTVRVGTVGQADLNGILSVTLKDGTKIGVRLEIEIKSGKARQTPEQKIFQRIIEDLGGIYIIARHPDKLIKDIRDEAEKRFGKGCLPESSGI